MCDWRINPREAQIKKKKMDRVRNNCSHSDNPVASANGRDGRGEGGKRRGDEKRKTVVKGGSVNDISALTYGAWCPADREKEGGGRKEKNGVNRNLSHRSAFEEQCWKGQLFENHFTSATAGQMNSTAIHRALSLG